MDFAHHLHSVRLEHIRRRAVDSAVSWAVNATNATVETSSYPQDASSHSEAELHRSLLSPWVLGVTLQAVFMGVVASQAHNLYLGRAQLSWKTWATTAVLLCSSIASFSAQTGTLWFFSMSSLGDIRYVILQFPPSLLVDLWLTPVTMSICNFIQVRYAYQASNRKNWLFCILLAVWLTELASSIARMVYTTLSYHGIDFNATMWSHMSYLHLTSRLAAILGPASLRLYFPIRRHELSNARHSIGIEVLGLLFRSSILATIPAAVEAATVLQERRFSLAANVAYTCTPRVCASATLASFLYLADTKQTQLRTAENQKPFREVVVMPVLNRPVDGANEGDSIEIIRENGDRV